MKDSAFSVITRQSLETIRQRLLDLSKRNQLLSYKEKARTVHITEISVETLFDKLVLEGKNMTFVPQTEEETHPPKKFQDSLLKTPHTLEVLERRCKKLAHEARIAIEETGSNLLYLAVGFLEWYEDKNAQTPTRAPLILIPVKLERTHWSKMTHYRYVLSYRDEDVETNISLAEKLANDFHLILPEFSDETDPESYLTEVRQLIEKMDRWQVLSDLRLDFFSFTKLLMYKDLDDNYWPEQAKLSENANLNKILAGHEDSSSTDNRYDDKSPIDHNPLTPKTPLILDADSSQQTVIMQALWHQTNFVVEGPPGTGKSQTITNLIAAALSQNKSVLFVAEKKAALDVVRSRLDKADLGEFCLELHSHKSQKTELHADIKKRLDKTYTDIEQLDRLTEELTEQKRQLLAYSHLVSTIVGPNDERIYEIFWAVERIRLELTSETLRYEITNPFQFTRDEFNQKINKLKDLSAQYEALSDKVRDHWQGFKPTKIWPGDEEEIHQILTTLLLETQNYKTYFERLIEDTQLPLTPDLATLHTLSPIETTLLTTLPDSLDHLAAIELLEPATITQLHQFHANQKEYQQLLTHALKLLEHEDYPPTLIKQLREAADELEQLGLGNESPEELNQLIQNVDKLDHELQSLLNNPESVDHFLNFLKLRELAEQAPQDLILNKYPKHALETTRLIFKHAHQVFAQLAAQWSEQEQFFLLRKLPPYETLIDLADELRRYQDNRLAILALGYWRTKNAIKNFLIRAKLFDKRDLVSRLETLAKLKRQIDQETQRTQYQELFGPLFIGLETDWAHLEQHISWAQNLAQALGSAEKAQELLAHQADPQNYILKNTAVIYEQWLRVTKAAEQLKVFVDSHLLVREFVEKLFERCQLVKQRINVLQQIAYLSDKHVISIQGAVHNLLTAWQLREDNQENSLLKHLVGDSHQGIETPVSGWITLADWITQLQTTSQMPPALLHWLVSENPSHRANLCQTLLEKNQAYLTTLTEYCQKLAAFGELDTHQWLNCTEDIPCSLSQMADTFQFCQSNVHSLGPLATFYFLKKEIDHKFGLSTITEAILSQQIQPAHAHLHFQYAFYQSMARELIRKYAELATFTRAGYENIRQRFAELDKTLLKINRQRIAYQIAQKAVPQGHGSGKVSQFTEKYLIEHELNKKKRHIPIRQLVRRASQALQALKPCFMMSPLSVAQYLPPGQVQFNLLIMDEASQVRPEDALGAIARSQQIVIVGDPKQLPPTQFFERLVNEEESPQTTTLEGQESILDICLSRYRRGRLRWHYRSEHESLIAFSNHHFYDDELIVFPAPQANHRDYGVHLNYIENAHYLKGRNQKEAETVVTAIIDHFRQYPKISLGIATFNIKQQELITDILDRACQQDTWLEEQIKGTEATEEPFFIKNLENVQGDERDVIFVSTTYGPDPQTDRVFQRFGPISSEMGWRRLNVIFTRAKKRLVLFTAMRSSDIYLTHDSKRGVQILKMYLEYAETGRLPDYGMATGREADSDFEMAVAKILAQYGYKTVPQVGVAGFRIDIGVCHPKRSHEYILGIECDGASYHSARSIRDRDRLRQEILENKGWKIHRIWSTDWFKNRDTEIERLLQVLSSIQQISVPNNNISQ